MSIAIIKYNAGNIFSVQCAMKRIGVEAMVTDDFEQIRNADKVIFPGVGEASSAMQHLRSNGLDALIKQLSQPVLGICIGMQLLCKHSAEGNVDCLGIFDTNVRRFNNTQQPTIKIPHMGWNTIEVLPNELILPWANGEYVYYVHSYYAPVCADTIATTEYITPFSAALHKDNFYATQFHPEKSGSVGEKILQQFLKL